MKALLFINGLPINKTPDNLSEYSIIACTDGAYENYVSKLDLPRIDFLSGDLDSIQDINSIKGIEIIPTPDQNHTDFHKAINILLDKEITSIDVYGGSGKESDHFIGNLSTALFFKDKVDITFYDEYSTFFFAKKETTLTDVKGKIISLIPFFEAKRIITKGLKYELKDESLTFGERIGTRNVATENNPSISFKEGNLLLYISKL